MERRTRRPDDREIRRRKESQILLDDTIPHVVKKILRPHFRKLLASEKGTIKGEDPEKLHTMRVSVRRMRTALRIFDDFLDEDEFEPFVRELRTLGRVLGPIRDIDVWILDAQRFREGVPLRVRLDLDGVVREWQAKREKLRSRMLEHVQSPRYRRFKRDLSGFLEDPLVGLLPPETKGGRIRPVSLRHLGPVILYRRLAAVRAYDGWVDDVGVSLRRYHRLRIEIKRLRYTLEFLSNVTGPEAEPSIAILRRAQDRLGEFRESWMIVEVLERELKVDGANGPDSTRHPGISAYLAAQRSRCEDLLEAFPSSWASIRNPEFNRRFAALAAAF